MESSVRTAEIATQRGSPRNSSLISSRYSCPLSPKPASAFRIFVSAAWAKASPTSRPTRVAGFRPVKRSEAGFK